MVAPVAVHAALPWPIARYISPLDYPAAAIASRAEGTVDLQLGVDSAGRLTSCTVRRSSGSAVLDATTCGILRRRLKFKPALDSTGQPVADIVDASYAWHFPSPDILRDMQPR
jgi:TonB family protein